MKSHARRNVAVPPMERARPSSRPLRTGSAHPQLPRQSAAGRSYLSPEPPAELAEETSARASLAREMLAQIPVQRSEDPERWRVHELLAHLLEFHRREQKSLHWARFERLAMTEQELIEDPDCLGALERTATAPVTVKRSFVYEYRFHYRNPNSAPAANANW